MKKVILFCLVAIMLTSCGHHSDGTSVWAEGLWIIPLLPAIGAVIWFIAAYRSSKSGSTINPIKGGGEGGNVPIYKSPFFLYAVCCVIAVVVIIFWVNAEK